MAIVGALRRGDYRPEQDGADCGACVLRNADGPVRSEFNDARWAIVAESPGGREVSEGRPLVGPSGLELQDALDALRLDRTDFDYINRMSCRPPGDRLGALLRRIQASNKRREAVNKTRRREHRKARLAGRPEQLELTPTPMMCCAPRFEHEVRRYNYLIPMGAVAARGVIPKLPSSASIMSIRGTLIELPSPDGQTIKVVPTLHPAFIRREPRWRRVFRRDIQRATQWFRGELEWEEPTITYQPTPDALYRFLNEPGVKFWPWDVETEMIKAGQQVGDLKLRCIGIGQEGHSVMVVPFASLEDPDRTFYSGRDAALIHALVARFLSDRRWAKVGHNAGNFDRLNVAGQLGCEVNGLLDTMLLHCVADSELPHTLALCGSYFTNVHAWKADHTATQARTDAELWRYNAIDVAVNGRILEPLLALARKRNQLHMMPLMHEMQKVCVGLTRVGIKVDQTAREVHRQRLVAEAQKYAEACRKALVAARVSLQELGPATDLEQVETRQLVDAVRALDHSDDATDPLNELFDEADSDWTLSAAEASRLLGLSAIDSTGYNPGSVMQKRRILYDEFKLPVPSTLKQKDAFTPGGDLSVSSTVLRAMLANPHIDPLHAAFIEANLHYAETVKAFGTFVYPLEHTHPRCLIDKKDGRAHASWRNHVAVTTRLASSPNQQNIMRDLRDMYVPADDSWFVYADYDQIEHRVAVARWGGARYEEAYEKGLDPHQITMYLIFGDRMWKWSGQPAVRFKKAGISGKFDRMRDLSKRVLYASQYGADDITVHRVITSATDENGNLMYRHLSVQAVAAMRDNLLRNWPELIRGWDREVAFYRANGFVVEPVTGRRRYLAEEKLTEIVNFPIQGGASGIINKATIRLVAAFPFFGPRGRGLINHMHDGLTMEILRRYAHAAASEMTEILTCTDPALPGVRFPAKAKVVTNLRADTQVAA